MTNEYIQQHFEIVFNGRADQRLCVEPDDEYVKRVRGLSTLLRHPAPKGQREHVGLTWDRRMGRFV